MKPFLSLIICLFFMPMMAFAQNLDSLEQLIAQNTLPDSTKLKVLKDLCWGFAHSETDKSIQYSDQAMDFLQQKNSMDSLDWAIINYYYGCAYKTKGEHEKSLDYFNKYKKVYVERNDTFKVASVQYQIGAVLKNKGDYDGAIEEYHKALESYQLLKHQNSIANTINAMASIDKLLKHYDKAEKRYKEALSIFIDIDNKIGQANIYNNLGNLLSKQKKYDEALTYYQLQEKINKEEDYEIGLGYVYENMGSLYKEKKDYPQAKKYFLQSLEIREKYDNLVMIAVSHILYGDLLVEMNDLTNGKFQLEKGLKIAEEHDFLPQKEGAFKGFSKLYEKQGNAEKAITFYKKYTAIEDSLLNKDVQGQIAKLDAKYENTLKENKILSLNTANEKKDIRNFWMSIGLFSALAMMAIIFYFLRQRQKNNKILEEKNQIISTSLEEKNILLKEIHHRVKNNLQIISSLLSLQSQHIEDKQAIEAINEGRNRVHSMALIHKSLYQKDSLLGISVIDYFEKLISELFAAYRVDHDKIILNIDVDDLQLDVDTMIPLGLIVNELVTNTLKYAFNGKENGHINVSLKEKNNQLSLKVEDDGIGIDDVKGIKNTDSFGYQLIDAFVAKMEGELIIDSNNGTSVTLLINDYEKSK